MSKEIIDHGFGVIETRETFYTEETIRQKDKKIAELEVKLAESEERCKKAYRDGLLQKQFDKDMEIDQLKQQLALTEKALELACANLYDINFKLYNTEMNFEDYFKQQAEKEMLENE